MQQRLPTQPGLTSFTVSIQNNNVRTEGEGCKLSSPALCRLRQEDYRGGQEKKGERGEVGGGQRGSRGKTNGKERRK